MTIIDDYGKEIPRADEKLNQFIQKLSIYVFNPNEQWAKDNDRNDIAQGVRLTKMRMSKLPIHKALQYFWSAISGTERSNAFFKTLDKEGLPTFEHFRQEITDEFNEEWLYAE